MIIDNTNNYESPVRLVGAKVELWEGSTLADTYNQYYGIKELTIERVGESKFFGFGICQRLNIHLIDLERYMYITTADSFKVFLSTGGDYTSSFPEFFVSEVHRDENTNELSVTAYDAIYSANSRLVSELSFISPLADEDLVKSYTIAEFAEACAMALGVGLQIAADAAESFSLYFEGGANFEGSETIREALNAIAEVTQTIYYIDSNNTLVFKRLDKDGEAVLSIDKSKYISLDSGENRRLQTIVSATELGDNISVSTSAIGSTQYVRNNPFWELREDIATLLDAALLAVGGLTINQFYCEWRGNPLLEIGDKISLTTKDNNSVISYLLNDTLFYDGSLSQSSQWEYEENDTESHDNPNNIGDALKQTFAKVDKVNKQIDIVVSQQADTKEQLSSLQLTTEDITATVQKVEQNVTNSLESLNSDISTLTNRVEASISAEDVQIQIDSTLATGVNKVTTTTGFTFNEEGLTVSKSGSEMTTTITEDGMIVYRDEEAVLTANNIGVNATNLHATTYLIIGNNSRIEDYGNDRSGCFWIGGNG